MLLQLKHSKYFLNKSDSLVPGMSRYEESQHLLV